MVTKLAARLEKEDNPQGWVMLARSYKMLGRYERSRQGLRSRRQLHRQRAGAARRLRRHPGRRQRHLRRQAARTDRQGPEARPRPRPRPVAVGHGGLRSRPFQSGRDRLGATAHAAAAGLGGGASVQGSLDEARAKGGKSSRAAAPAAKEKPVTQVQKVGAGATVNGRVELAAALKGKAAPADTVMVIARPADGSRMPVAVLKARQGERTAAAIHPRRQRWPMNPDHAISKHKEVIIEARISKTGMANPQPGDLLSAPQTVKVGSNGDSACWSTRFAPDQSRELSQIKAKRCTAAVRCAQSSGFSGESHGWTLEHTQEAEREVFAAGPAGRRLFRRHHLLGRLQHRHGSDQHDGVLHRLPRDAR